jgi:hypothetical protein
MKNKKKAMLLTPFNRVGADSLSLGSHRMLLSIFFLSSRRYFETKGLKMKKHRRDYIVSNRYIRDRESKVYYRLGTAAARYTNDCKK